MPTSEYNIDGFVYEFCGDWYIQIDGEETNMTPLKYIGTAKQKVKTNHFLGYWQIKSGILDSVLSRY